MTTAHTCNVDYSHLDALNLRLSHERTRQKTAKNPAERELRMVWISQIEREIAAERAFLGLADDANDMSDDELMKALEE